MASGQVFNFSVLQTLQVEDRTYFGPEDLLTANAVLVIDSWVKHSSSSIFVNRVFCSEATPERLILAAARLLWQQSQGAVTEPDDL